MCLFCKMQYQNNILFNKEVWTVHTGSAAAKSSTINKHHDGQLIFGLSRSFELNNNALTIFAQILLLIN